MNRPQCARGVASVQWHINSSLQFESKTRYAREQSPIVTSIRFSIAGTARTSPICMRYGLSFEMSHLQGHRAVCVRHWLDKFDEEILGKYKQEIRSSILMRRLENSKNYLRVGSWFSVSVLTGFNGGKYTVTI